MLSSIANFHPKFCSILFFINFFFSIIKFIQIFHPILNLSSWYTILYIKANVVSVCLSVCSSQTFADCGQGSGMKELYVRPSICPSIRPSSFLFFFFSWFLSVCSSVRQSFRPSVLLSVINLPIIPCPIFRFAYLYFFSFLFGQPRDWPTQYV
jgi:hypothetical protein